MVDRRRFLSLAALAAAVTKTQAQTRQAPLRVQWTNGGHTVPLKYYTMLDDATFSDLDSTLFSFPNPFRTLNAPASPAVVVLCDWGQPWTQQDKDAMQKHIEAGKGLVVLHHSLADNVDWPWYYQDVMGGVLNQRGIPGLKPSRLKAFPKQLLTPIGDHPIVRGMHPFELPQDEVFVDMWLSPKSTPLIKSDDPDIGENVIAWIGPHPKARVVCFESGHTQWACADPRYRHLVHNMILWAGQRLT